MAAIDRHLRVPTLIRIKNILALHNSGSVWIIANLNSNLIMPMPTQ
jgi:hypothetical protein